MRLSDNSIDPTEGFRGHPLNRPLIHFSVIHFSQNSQFLSVIRGFVPLESVSTTPRVMCFVLILEREQKYAANGAVDE